jgi:hypothetical protein
VCLYTVRPEAHNRRRENAGDQLGLYITLFRNTKILLLDLVFNFFNNIF